LRRRGVVLLAVLVIVVLLSLSAYKYSDWTTSEYRASEASIRASQAKAFATSGVHYVAAMLVGNADSLGGNPYDNPQAFQSIAAPSPAHAARTGRFTIVTLCSPDEMSGSQSYRFGLTDEAGKINLNALLALDKGKGDAGKSILMALPNMSEDIAKSI